MTAADRYCLSGSAPERYEANMVPAIFEPFAAGLVEAADLQPGKQVIDIACGTGIAARLAWPRLTPGGRLVGLDVNPGMLEVAATAFAGFAGAGGVELREGDACALPFADGEFDVVICHHGLQYFPDKEAAAREMFRVLRDGGRLAASVWRPVDHNPGHAVFARVLDRHVGEEAGNTRRAPFRLSDREEIRDLIASAGFSDVTIELDTRVARFPSAEEMIRIMMAGTPLADAMKDADPAVLDAVISEVTEGLAEYRDDRGLALPMQAWVVIARK